MSKPTDLGSIKKGSSIIINGEPCKVVQYDKSKPGKHGSAKARVVGIGIFDDVKRSLVSPVSANVEVPLIDKRNGQVISKAPNSIQIMDLESYEIFETALPSEPDLLSRVDAGVNVEYWSVMGRHRLIRVKS